MKVAYPVIFTDVDNNILIEVPDLQILTEANDEDEEKGTLADAIMMARDAIGLAAVQAEDEDRELTEASQIGNVDIVGSTFAGEGNSFVSLVDVDITEYRKKNDMKTVRRNVTLPNWLNIEADRAGINVSKVLQDALMTTLNVSRL